MRPLGGLILGPLGDRVGRRTVLVISVSVISLTTFLVGVLPGEAAIGLRRRSFWSCYDWLRVSLPAGRSSPW